MNRSPIPWLGANGFTWNPVTGCTFGCDYCYARKIADRFGCKSGNALHYAAQLMSSDCVTAADDGAVFPVGFEPTIYPHRLNDPITRRKPATVFLGSMGDLFDPAFPDSFRDRIFLNVLLTPHHRYVVLTKRAQAMHDYLTNPDRASAVFLPLKNLILGVTVTNQEDADTRIPLLLETPAAYRMVSVEPMLGPVTFRWAPWDDLTPNDRRKERPGEACNGRTQKDGLPLAASVDHLDGLRMLDFVAIGAKTPGKPLHMLHKCVPCPAREPLKQHACTVGTCDWDSNTPSSWLRELLEQCTEARIPVNYKHGNDTPSVDNITYDCTLAELVKP